GNARKIRSSRTTTTTHTVTPNPGSNCINKGSLVSKLPSVPTRRSSDLDHKGFGRYNRKGSTVAAGLTKIGHIEGHIDAASLTKIRGVKARKICRIGSTTTTHTETTNPCSKCSIKGSLVSKITRVVVRILDITDHKGLDRYNRKGRARKSVVTRSSEDQGHHDGTRHTKT